MQLKSTLVATLLLSSLGPALGQVQLYATDFMDGSDWTLEQGCWQGTVRWRINALPPPFPLPAGAQPSGPWSLNFNNGQGWIPNGHHCGTATSPPIDLTLASGAPALEFWYGWDHEAGCEWDAFDLRILSAATGAVLYEECLSADPSPHLGHREWSPWSKALDRAWGIVRVQFSHDTIDKWNGWESGSWVDDVRVVCDPCVPCGASVQCLGAPQHGGAPPAELALLGTTSIGAADATILGAEFVPHTFATLLAAPAAASLPAGHGVQCVARAATARLGVAPTRAFGRPVWSLDLGAPPLAAMAGVGAPLFVQATFRDGASFNFSSALRLDVCP